MIKYPCLVLDHDDTVVQSEATINYPFFCSILERFRPGQTMTLAEYTHDCFYLGFADMCRKRFSFTEGELADEYQQWLSYVRTHIPPFYAGMESVIHRQRELGGLVCVVSHSSTENITRDYQVHFGVQPDAIYSWDLPKELRKPSIYPLQDIMRHYGFTPNELLVVDDMKSGYDMAHQAGVKIGFAAWSRTGFPDISEQMRTLCDFSFATPAELAQFLFDSIDRCAIISEETDVRR